MKSICPVLSIVATFTLIRIGGEQAAGAGRGFGDFFKKRVKKIKILKRGASWE
jgi:hypothetical protein